MYIPCSKVPPIYIELQSARHLVIVIRFASQTSTHHQPSRCFPWENTPEGAIRSITVEAQELKRAALRYVAVGQDPSLRVPAAEVLRSSRSFEGRDAMLQLLQEPNLGGWLMGVKAKRGQFSTW